MRGSGSFGIAAGVSLLLACSTPARPRHQADAEPARPVDAGPQIGQSIPDFEGLDQTGRPQSFRSLAGSSGLLLNFNRSIQY